MINSNEILHNVYNIFTENSLPYEYNVFGRFVNVSVEDASFEDEDCCGETYSSDYTFIKARV